MGERDLRVSREDGGKVALRRVLRLGFLDRLGCLKLRRIRPGSERDREIRLGCLKLRGIRPGLGER